MKRSMALLVLALSFTVGVAHAEKYRDTIATFRQAGASGWFFNHSYAYAVFPAVGEGGFIVGAAIGKGRVYVHGQYVGNTTMTQLSGGFQAGAKAYSQIIFFEDKRALQEFESGSFEFKAGASAIAVTAAVDASAGTNGVEAGVSVGPHDASTTGIYEKGMAVFTVAKGGLMYAATIAGQQFSYNPKGS